ncbi:hyaluronidase-1-like [Branchiostoma floridae]|uniref:Hyaluronidase n=1 Tax=Branchiostoma floridae TaxID=7739 RepID=A0A9J7MBW8_BRAFL|nr:hyaluronidase-1-like [Branchiostoma floridae]
MASPKEVLSVVILAVQLVVVSTENADRPFSGPPLPSRPFLAVWNLPTINCDAKFGVDINPDSYNIVTNPGQRWNGSYMTIFSYNRLGLYPYYNNSRPVRGGVPQVVNITAHLAKAAEDIVAIIPDPDFQGLAVIDWEKWKPVWHRNEIIYKNASRELVEKRHPDWPKEKIEAVSKEEFETAARTMFEETILLARKLRPKGLWGYYHFPACYNDRKRKHTTGYICPEEEKEFNNQIQWLFRDSTVIYPSIYLTHRFASTEDSQRLVYFRIKEAFRMAASRTEQNVPVYAYTRFSYVDTGEYLTKADLMNTIGQTANLGADGIVIWGSDQDTKTKEKCLRLQSYLRTTLGPFIFNITTAAARCSQQHCSGHGRCVLATGSHGNHLSFDLQHSETMEGDEIAETMKNVVGISYGNTTGEGNIGKTTKHFAWSVNFDKRVDSPSCKCYPGWTGKSCQDKL